MDDTAFDSFLMALKQLITSSKYDLVRERKHELQSLEKKMKYLREFLKLTEKKYDKHSKVTKLVTEIRRVVAMTEKTVDSLILLAFKDDASDSLSEHQTRLSLNLQRVDAEFKTLSAEVHQIFYDIEYYSTVGEVSKKLKQSSTRRGGSSEGDTSKEVEEQVVVGFDEEMYKLIEKLDHRSTLEIISIIGQSGAGKTTLARELYNHPFISFIFEVRVWVLVSPYYDKTMKRDLLIHILESISPGNHEDYEKSTGENILGEKVLKCLKGRKYLIVMDNIWSIEAWNDIQRSFPKEHKGSKVLFTSRVPVQPDDIGCVFHHMAPLNKSHSWSLFQKKVFGIKCCPPELVDIGELIAEKCRGVPLAIVTIAGFLEKKDKSLVVWKEVSERLNSILAENQEFFAYDYLPLHLQACLLYIAAFPEDYEIPVRELIWLWIAEGFIQEGEEWESLEDNAKRSLFGLVDRNLVAVTGKTSLGEIKACRIHDLLRDLCIKKAMEDNFLVQIYRDDSFSHSTTNEHRRLFIGSHFFHKFSLRPRARNIHSFMCLSLPNSSLGLSFEPYLSFFAENFELLRVLSFIPIACQGKIGIGHLVHLKYLALKLQSEDWYCALPFSCLLNLETLSLQAPWHNARIQLPRDIFKMVNLRHLYTKYGVFHYDVSCLSTEEAASIGFDRSSKLDSLQTLHRICSCEDCRSFLVRTPNLRKLGVYGGLMSQDGVLMLPDLEFLKCLEALSFTNERANREPMLSTLPEWLKFPPTLTRLTLCCTCLKWEQLSILQTLPNLEVLKLLRYACRGPVWNASGEEGFCRLKYLRFQRLDIQELNASEDQFPRLEVLELEECKNLKRIPIDFAYLNELREIKIERCHHSVEISARKIQEEQRNRNGDDGCLNLLTKENW